MGKFVKFTSVGINLDQVKMISKIDNSLVFYFSMEAGSTAKTTVYFDTYSIALKVYNMIMDSKNCDVLDLSITTQG